LINQLHKIAFPPRVTLSQFRHQGIPDSTVNGNRF